MKFIEGTPVYTEDNEKVGEIDRVVIDPHTQEVSHLVVEQGFLFTEDKVIPVSKVGSANSEEVRLKAPRAALELPDFQETAYIPLHEIDGESRNTAIYQRPLYSYPPVGATATWGRVGYFDPTMHLSSAEVTERNVPQNHVALEEGAEVYSSDSEHVGNVEGVFTDEDEQVTHFVISQGFLFEDQKLIPIFWIDRTEDTHLHLSVHSETLQELPDHEYEPQEA